MKTVLVTGSNGLVGSAIRRAAETELGRCFNWKFSTRQDTNLTKLGDVKKLFQETEPDMVLHTAARVGGIERNINEPHRMFIDNIRMNTNVLDECLRYSPEKVLAFSSVCVFPDDLAVLQEDRMHDGPVFGDNFAYGYAKRMVDVQIRAAKKEYGVKGWCSVIPGNIAGPADYYSLTEGHVVPALIHKMYLAKKSGGDLHLFGDGQSLREFLHVDDLAQILLRLLHLPQKEVPERLIVSGRQEHSIRQIVDWLAEIAGFDGKIVFDGRGPNGQRSRPSDKTLVDGLFPDMTYTDVYQMLIDSWNYFEENYPNVRT